MQILARGHKLTKHMSKFGRKDANGWACSECGKRDTRVFSRNGTLQARQYKTR